MADFTGPGQTVETLIPFSNTSQRRLSKNPLQNAQELLKPIH